MELKNNHKNFVLLPIVANGIFAETLDLLLEKWLNESKRNFALQILITISVLDLCVYVGKACQLFEVLPAPFEDNLIGFLVFLLQ